MEVPREMKVIPPQEKDLMMIVEPEYQEIEELIGNLTEIKGIMDLQRMDDIHPDEDHQDHQEEEDLLVPLDTQDILDPLETKDLQDPLDHEDIKAHQDLKDIWDCRDHRDRSLDHHICLDPLLHPK